MSEANIQRPARFDVGDTVVIADFDVVGHCRTPWYVRGKTGTVVEIQGVFRDPVRLAYHRPGLPAQVLYKVRLRQSDLWPRYQGATKDHLEVDIYEPWLMPAERAPRTRNAKGSR